MRDSTEPWQAILSAGFSSANELLQFLGLSPEIMGSAAEKTFKTRVPRGFAARMQHGNRFDPLLLQVLASAEELEPVPGYTKDPLHEDIVNPIPGLIHKYASRVLLTVTGGCAVHCRYCFRRHFPYEANNPGRQGWQKAIEYIQQDDSIQEVILSGGDPLLANDHVLLPLFDTLANLPQINIIRFHTRIPIVLPERIQQPLLQCINDSRVKTVMVLHSNHPNELNTEVERACQALREANCYLLNQSVLLKGVNDEAKTLAQLSYRLFSFGVLPYYLHLLDKVQGAHHFDVAMTTAKMIYQELQAILPGYLLPRLVREEPQKKSKTLCSV